MSGRSFRLFILKCPEVGFGFSFGCSEIGLYFSLLGFQKLDSSFAFICVQGYGSYLVVFVVVAAAAVSVVIWSYAIGRSLLMWKVL